MKLKPTVRIQLLIEFGTYFDRSKIQTLFFFFFNRVWMRIDREIDPNPTHLKPCTHMDQQLSLQKAGHKFMDRPN